MSSRLKEWAMNTPEFQHSEQQAELGPHDSEYWLQKLEEQLPEARKLRKTIEDEKRQGQLPESA